MKHLKRLQLRPVACLLGLTLIGILGCRETPKTDESETPEEEAQVVNAPKQIISLDEARMLFDTYSERRVALIERFEIPNSDSGAFSAARYAFFDYATIKEYIAFIEQEADSAKVDISGLRFYFGNYPESDDDADKANEKRNTVFVVPTLERDGNDFGFYTREGADGHREAALIMENSGQSDKSGNGALHESPQRSYAGFAPAGAPVIFAGEQSLILNRGNVGPPPNNDF
jgi:hypothetical protein